jgi:hypothetical protein
LLPNFGRIGKVGKGIDRVLDIYILKKIYDWYAPKKFIKENSKELGINTEKREEEYIVSLTSFPARINLSWISIECLMRQSFKPDRIILWLAEEQIDMDELPESLLILKGRGLEIEFCDDIKSHKKYFYAMKNYPNANILTFDDDLYYDSYVVENLIKLHEKFPKNIVSNRAHKIRFSGDKLMPYRIWHHNVIDNEPSFKLFHTSGAGVLFPGGCLAKETFDKDLIKELSLRSDDVWLKVMSIRNDIKLVTNDRYNKDFSTVRNSQIESLVFENTIQGGKDEKLNQVLTYFNMDLYKILNNVNINN